MTKKKKELINSQAKKCLKHDISLPINNIEKFHLETQKMISSKIKKQAENFPEIFAPHPHPPGLPPTGPPGGWISPRKKSGKKEADFWPGGGGGKILRKIICLLFF